MADSRKPDPGNASSLKANPEEYISGEDTTGEVARGEDTSPNEDYSKQAYWERRYSAPGNKPFEWFFTYEDILPILHHHIRQRQRRKLHRIIDLGCGDSHLLFQLCKAGFGAEFLGFDFAASVVEAMQQRSREEGVAEHVWFHVGDVCAGLPIQGKEKI